MSETILILAVGTVVLAILFGARIVMRAIGGEATQDGSAASGGNGPSSSDVPGVIALPPFIFLGFLVAATVLEAVIPLPVLAAHAIARYVVGTVLVVSGFVMIGLGTRRFVAAAPTFRRICRRRHWLWTASMGGRETRSIWARRSFIWA